jgi:hypothetical protein
MAQSGAVLQSGSNVGWFIACPLLINSGFLSLLELDDTDYYLYCQDYFCGNK